MGLVATEHESGNRSSTDSIEHQQNLEQEKRRIEKRLTDYRQQLADPNRQRTSMGDTAIDGGTTLDIQLQNSITTDQIALSQVNMALENARNGTYGICQGCGKKIPEKRLKAQLDACFCIKCQTAAEKGENPNLV